MQPREDIKPWKESNNLKLYSFDKNLINNSSLLTAQLSQALTLGFPNNLIGMTSKNAQEISRRS